MGFTRTQCPSCGQGVFTVHCDSCQKVIPDGERNGAIEYFTRQAPTGGSPAEYRLQLELCASCRNSAVNLEQIAKRVIRETMQPPGTATVRPV